MSIEINSGWEERLQQINEQLPIIIRPSLVWNPDLVYALSESELERFKIKLRLIEQAAEEMAKEMLKGTVKYSSDDWAEADWEEAFTQELYGLLNYRLLMRRQHVD